MYRSINQQELTKFQKNEARILAKLISELWNLSMTLEGFPDAYEIAKIKPVFKKSSKTDPSNYRPKSLLPLLSKVFESVVLDQTEGFLSLIRSYYMTINPAIRRTTPEIHLFLF